VSIAADTAHPGPGPIAFVWDNFGPLHADRCDAVAEALGRGQVLGLEIMDTSNTYSWPSSGGVLFEKITLFHRRAPSALALANAILGICLARRVRAAFFCHYNMPGIFLAALALRVMGRPVFTMFDSKFDDCPRHLWREFLKRVVFLPYSGALVASRRSSDYARMHGLDLRHVAFGYDTLNIHRFRSYVEGQATPPFAERHFTVIARLEPKKNISLAIQAFARLQTGARRKLVICGSGRLESELKSLAADLGVEADIEFRGWLQSGDVARVLACTLALILPSVEEQYGQVVGEAHALSIPTIVSENCGARDELVRNGVNGFIIEPDNVEGLAYFMGLISQDESLWRRFSEHAARAAALSDIARFAASVETLLSGAIRDRAASRSLVDEDSAHTRRVP
jgi:glycosyltransferase involved in cell wall biosynthesis